MSYENAPSTKLLATHCIVCSRPLRDAASVEIGIGPDCREKYGFDVEVPGRVEANRIVHHAAIAAHAGDVKAVLTAADQIEVLGLTLLADTIRRRFVLIRLEDVKDGEITWTQVFTPYNPDFVGALHRAVQNGDKRQNRDPETKKFKCWEIKHGARRGLLQALSRVFGGKQAMGPRGVFEIPTVEEFQTKFAR